MAKFDDLLARVADEGVRSALKAEYEQVTKNKKFGLVFEEHLPECTPLWGVKIRRGMTVARKGGEINDPLVVQRIKDGVATCWHASAKQAEEIALDDLIPIARFGDPIYPVLTPIDAVENAPGDKLWHTLIQADNYHALQLLEYLYPGKVDCIYIDPPYNTGARDWKYNNDYVDKNDAYRHSKWLSMMQKRLRIAKNLLKGNGVLITAIDENEFATLMLLLEEIFPECKHEVISIRINPRGTQDSSIAAVADYAIVTHFKDSEIFKTQYGAEEYSNLRKWGGTSNRDEGANCFYPIFLNDKKEITGFGDVLDDDVHPIAQTESDSNGGFKIWPIDVNDVEKKWRYARDSVEEIQDRLMVKEDDGRLEVYIRRATETPKTIWTKESYNAETHGTKLIKKFIGADKFSYPKSLYTVRDCLYMTVAGKPNALVLDFFAGSGTTLHAVNLLNAEDGGARRCIMVTNNEVSEKVGKKLTDDGFAQGDEEWENAGIARAVTWPRTQCSILGKDVNGEPIPGNYGVKVESYEEDDESLVVSRKSGKPLRRVVYKKTKIELYPTLEQMKMSEGFKSNCEFFKLDFADKDKVSLGKQFKELLPILWMKSGAKGKRPTVTQQTPDMLVLPENEFAVLANEAAFIDFEKQVKSSVDIHDVYLVTDSNSAFKEMSLHFPDKRCVQLYRDYLNNFRINKSGR